MNDVAALAGVGQATVSFVLNGRDDMRISAETRNKVMNAAKKLGYKRRAAGRPPSEVGHGVIGLLIDEVATSPFAMITIDGAQEEAWENDILIDVALSGRDKQYESAILRRWTREGVIGVIYASIITRSAEPPDALSAHRALMLNCYDKGGQFPSVTPAERQGGEVATTKLIDAGRTRIAIIRGEGWMEASEQRFQGYLSALKKRGIEFDERYAVEGNFLPSGGRQGTEQLLRLSNPPDAIFCSNDLMALGCFETLKRHGITPGKEIAVVGYDDQLIARHLDPPLSTVILPHREMGIWAVQQLLSNKSLKFDDHRIECPFVERESH